MTAIFANWGGGRVKLTWNKDDQLPKRRLITSVHGFCFHEGQFLLVNLNERGWDFPGGHIEADETPEACFKREAMEEGYVEGQCRLLGYIIVDHSGNPKWDETSPYPKIGYQVYYRMNIERLHPFEAEYESKGRILINPEKVGSYYSDWNELFQEIMDHALSL